MNIKLSVIIPYYTEQPQDILPILSSLNNQIDVDFREIEVILVNDGNQNKLPDSFLKLFGSLAIRCVYLEENRGAGVARQAGIDNAAGEYLMFCDADDFLFSANVLRLFFDDIDKHHPDVIASLWLEEHDMESGKFRYITYENEIAWLHGKVIERKFLRENNIRFHEKLRAHEDTYFMMLVTFESQSGRKIQQQTYVWRDNRKSMTRKNNAAYRIEAAPDYVKSMACAFDELEKRYPGKLEYLAVYFMVYQYYALRQKEWRDPGNIKLKKAVEEAFRNLFRPYYHYFIDAQDELIEAIYNARQSEFPGSEKTTEDLRVWLNGIML